MKQRHDQEHDHQHQHGVGHVDIGSGSIGGNDTDVNLTGSRDGVSTAFGKTNLNQID